MQPLSCLLTACISKTYFSLSIKITDLPYEGAFFRMHPHFFTRLSAYTSLFLYFIDHAQSNNVSGHVYALRIFHSNQLFPETPSHSGKFALLACFRYLQCTIH